jgi:glycosyltransferase involved in cell wall biosynthesis
LGRANDFRVIAILAVYNEERFIRGCLENLARHGIQVYLIDNCSTDSTVSIAKEHSNVIGIETFPRDGVYRWRPILQRKEALAEVLEADWFMHIDADERHLPPFSGTTLAEALRKTGEQGWNAVNFHEYSFVPTAEHPDHDHPDFEKTMKWYYAHEPRFPWRLNAWKKQPARVDIASSGGHQVKFPALKLCPENFHMKHYVFLSKAHALQKYKAKQYDEKELQEGWHGWRAQLVAEAIDLPREATLNEYISDDRLDPTRPWKSEWLECAIESHKKKVFGISSTTALPFDQYQRYRIVSDIINKYRRGSERFKILDVGAGFEENLKKFLPEDDVYCQDKDYPESFSQKENFISGDFISLELDDTYDFVISIDCYEHIPPSGRQLYVNKLIAASRTATIIAAPFDTEGVREMETLASELYRMTHGTSYRWLEEHIQNGLPSLDYTLEMVRKLGFKTLVVPNGYLARWFQMISLYLLSVDREEFIAILQNLWEFYNRNFYPFDNKAPAYRHVLIIDKTNKMEMPSFDALVSTRSEAGDDFKFKEKLLHNYFDQIKYLLQKTFQEKVEMQGAVISRLEAAMAQKDADLAKRAAHIARLDSAMAEKDADIAKRAAHIVHLDSVIARLEGEHHRKDEFLNNLYSSHGWRVLSKYYRMRDKMLPQNAKRRVIAKLVFHSLAGIARRCFRRLKSEDPSVPGPGMRSRRN